MKDTLKAVTSFVAVNALAGFVQTVAASLTHDFLEGRRKKEAKDG